MTFQLLFDPKKTIKLIEMQTHFNLLKQLILEEKLPKIIMLSGTKGIGKSTLVNHLMCFIFDKKNYNEEENIISENSNFFSQFLNNAFPNIININKNINIDDVRALKNQLSKAPINSDKRFIIIDDIETLNHNCLNGLLKLIEEPGNYNYFILINNKTKSILETVKSRAIEINVILNESQIEKISSYLLNKFNQEAVFDRNLVHCSPGNFLKFNYIFSEHKINTNEKFVINLKKLLTLYKKEKNIFYKNTIVFFTDYYLKKIQLSKNLDNNQILTNRSLILENINDFFLYNFNQDTLVRSIESRILNE